VPQSGKQPLAPGDCTACHPKDFPLKPPSHLEPNFFPRTTANSVRPKPNAVRAAKGSRSERGRPRRDHGAEKAAETTTGTAEHEVPEGVDLPPVDTINTLLHVP